MSLVIAFIMEFSLSDFRRVLLLLYQSLVLPPKKMAEHPPRKVL